MKKTFETPVVDVLRLEVLDSLTNETVNGSSIDLGDGTANWGQQ